MKDNSSFLLLFIPLILLSILSSVLFVERTGFSSDPRQSSLDFLDPVEDLEILNQTQVGDLKSTVIGDEDLLIDQTEPGKVLMQTINVGDRLDWLLPDLPRPSASEGKQISHKETESLLLFDSNGIEGPQVQKTVKDALDSMRVRYTSQDVTTTPELNLEEFQTVVITFVDLEKIESQAQKLIDWAEDGGRVLFAIRPDPSPTFSSIYRKLGILSKIGNLIDVSGVNFTSELFPGTKGISLGSEFINHNSIPVQLEENSIVHMVSADEYALPIMWESNYGKGRFVVLNSDQFNNKSSRGVICAAYSLLKDISIYPVINSAVFFIDDFPSPIPQGESELITQQFGRDLQSFYINIWWPDMQGFARKYGIKYTGVIIVTYEEEVEPPFNILPDVETFNYFGSSLLSGGGEIGLHGYNHVPLCLEESGYNQKLGYPVWYSENDMRNALTELYLFAESLFPDQPMNTYVPPSNMLCPQTREWLNEALPSIKIIASVYLQDPDIPEYYQEFEEASDGIIELPRIVAGFDVNEFMHWTAINEIFIHYIHTHFVHPDDLIDSERSGGQTWTTLRDKLNEYLLWLYISAPEIRNMTSREAAMAVQRFYRLELDTYIENDIYQITLENFYDEAWLLMRSLKTPRTIEGGSFSEVSENLFLVQAQQPKVSISFKE